MILTRKRPVKSKGACDVLGITGAVARAVKEAKIVAGSVTLLCPGLTTLEFEDGVVHDLQQALDDITPPDRTSRHPRRWHDDNGHSRRADRSVAHGAAGHVAANRLSSPRARTLIVQMMGE